VKLLAALAVLGVVALLWLASEEHYQGCIGAAERSPLHRRAKRAGMATPSIRSGEVGKAAAPNGSRRFRAALASRSDLTQTGGLTVCRDYQ
jgi:hypothetical protein